MLAASTAPGPSARRRPREIVARIFGGLAITVIGAWNGGLLALTAALHCMDGCPTEDPGSWMANTNAWQWDALMWLGLASFATCVVLALSLVTRKARVHQVCFGVALVVNLAPWILSATG